MLLLIDAGNTRIKWALAAPGSVAGQWHASGVVKHGERGKLAAQWQNLDVDAVWVSNVAGPEVRTALCAQLLAISTPGNMRPTLTWFASVPSLGGVRNRYREPASLGCDRFAALLGAQALRTAQALIVATCGTATTVDALDAQGEFVGGMILPGPGLMAASLAQRTAQLPQLETEQAQRADAISLFADNTRDAIRSGCLTAQAGAIERAAAAHGGAHCLLSGGAAAWVAPYLSIPFTLVENLVLTGLHVAAQVPGIASATASSLPDTTGAVR